MNGTITDDEGARLRARALYLLSRYDRDRERLAHLKRELDTACAEYGRVSRMWGYSADILRREINNT